VIKQVKVNSRERVVLESKFGLSQLETFKFVFSEVYFKPYAINIADQYKHIIKPCIVASIGCSTLLSSKQVLDFFCKLSRYTVTFQGTFFFLPTFLFSRSHDLPLPYHLIDHMTSHLTSHLTLCQQHHMTRTKVLVPIVRLIGTSYCSPFLLFSYLLFCIIDLHFLLAMTS